MKYYIQRQLNEYGPYTLADLQRYVAQGNILLTDLTRSEGMSEWVAVSQVIGNIPIPVPPPAVQIPVAPSQAGATTAYGTPGGVYGAGAGPYTAAPYAPGAYGAGYAAGVPRPAMMSGPLPPDLHWALVLLISAFCGVFHLVWLFIQAGFVKKLSRDDNSMGVLIGAMVIQLMAFVILFGGVIAMEGRGDPPASLGFVFFLILAGGAVLQWIGVFKMRSTLETYYNTVEPINLQLNPVMTFFFAVYYFQYHFSRIAAWKKTGYLAPQ
jgi:hypothetical protein